MINEPVVPAGQEPERDSPFQRVHEGMHVYDRDGKDIGSVARVFTGEVSPRANDLGAGPATSQTPIDPRTELLRDVARVFDSDNVPEEMRDRLERMGFIRLDTAGLFSSDRYILPEQVARVDGDMVHLKTTKDELLKSH